MWHAPLILYVFLLQNPKSNEKGSEEYKALETFEQNVQLLMGIKALIVTRWHSTNTLVKEVLMEASLAANTVKQSVESFV